MSKQPQLRVGSQPPPPPPPSTYQVERPKGKSLTFHECFIQLGGVNDVPGSLIVYHFTGQFALAAFAPGHWRNVQRIETMPPKRGWLSKGDVIHATPVLDASAQGKTE